MESSKDTRMHTARLWFARLVAAYALLLFAFLTYLYVAEPTDHIEKFGITKRQAEQVIEEGYAKAWKTGGSGMKDIKTSLP